MQVAPLTLPIHTPLCLPPPPPFVRLDTALNFCEYYFCLGKEAGLDKMDRPRDCQLSMVKKQLSGSHHVSSDCNSHSELRALIVFLAKYTLYIVYDMQIDIEILYMMCIISTYLTRYIRNHLYFASIYQYAGKSSGKTHSPHRIVLGSPPHEVLPYGLPVQST